MLGILYGKTKKRGCICHVKDCDPVEIRRSRSVLVADVLMHGNAYWRSRFLSVEIKVVISIFRGVIVP
jgi:hypothetical protein